MAPSVAAVLAMSGACSTDPGMPLGIDGDAAASFEIPVGEALQPWLIARGYDGMPAESSVHPSSGPHGSVRTFLSPGLVASLSSRGDHPRGVGAVKELHDGNGLLGWSVEVKIADDSAGGNGWYWYEVIGTSASDVPVVDGTGARGCTDCHDAGRDYVRTPFPLR